jgi:hypothetical protein
MLMGAGLSLGPRLPRTRRTPELVKVSGVGVLEHRRDQAAVGHRDRERHVDVLVVRDARAVRSAGCRQTEHRPSNVTAWSAGGQADRQGTEQRQPNQGRSLLQRVAIHAWWQKTQTPRCTQRIRPK